MMARVVTLGMNNRVTIVTSMRCRARIITSGVNRLETGIRSDVSWARIVACYAVTCITTVLSNVRGAGVITTGMDCGVTVVRCTRCFNQSGLEA